MRKRLLASVALALLAAPVVRAGVTNPDISVIGQPLIRWTDDANSFASKRPVFDVGETEFVFDAALNPYARGFFAVSMAEGDVGVEEGYFTLLRGLPGDITLKGGKYRAGFGKLNATHPHTYPFAERPGVLAAFLPGAESFNETGLSVGWRVPVPGSWSITAYADVLQGDSFRIERTPGVAANDPLLIDPDQGDRTSEPRSAWLGRLDAFAPIGDRSGLELGLSATEGTNNVAASTRTLVYGGDAKLKLWTSPSAYLLVQGEYLQLERDIASWVGSTASYNRFTVHANGGYLFADYNWKQRYNAGVSAERYGDTSVLGAHTTSFGAFVGLALMEETTAFRLDWKRSDRSDDGTVAFGPFPSLPVSDPTQALTLRVIFSMGPHKAHQF